MRRVLSDAVKTCASIVSFGLALTFAPVEARADLPPLSPAAVASGTQIIHAYGHEFSVIGSPGNAAVPAQYQTLPNPTPGLGSVDVAFGLARAEVTNAQYLQFVRAYAPHFDITNSVEFLGIGIRVVGDTRNPNNYFIRPGWENVAAEMGWRYAARYCNWLTNNQGNTPSAFLTGSYNASTFSPDPPTGPVTDDTQRLSTARFFIPTQNEWLKGMYFDPNRFGVGQPGYWANPITSDEYAIQGLPQNGGTTNAGISDGFPPFPIVQYPTVQSPWGLFDGSGGAREWLENSNEFARFFRSTDQVSGSPFDDRIQLFRSNDVGVADRIGLRLGMVIPGPSVIVTAVAVVVVFRRRRT